MGGWYLVAIAVFRLRLSSGSHRQGATGGALGVVFSGLVSV